MGLKDEQLHVLLRPGIYADATGALYLERSGALLIADAHLGYAWAQRRRGELGPITDGGVGERLRGVVERWHPREIVFLGDLVHLARPSLEEQEFIEGILRGLAEQAEVTVVLGNHDRRFVRDFGHLGLRTERQWEDGDVYAVHGDREWADTEKWFVLGHLHPAVGFADAAGATQRVPVFVAGSRALVLPAFSPFAFGFDLRKALTPEWRLLFGDEPVQLVAATGSRARMFPRPFMLRYRRLSATSA